MKILLAADGSGYTKKALAWLAREMPHHHALCAAALRPGASDETIAAWMAAVIDDTPSQPIDPA